MPLMRVLTRVDEKGKIPFPNNIRLQAGLKPGQLVELRLVGGGKKTVVVSARSAKG